MSLVQIRMKDKVLQRMLMILLNKKGVEVALADKKDANIPDGCSLIITDLASADRETLRFEKTFFVCKDGEIPPENAITYKRPFLMESFISDAVGILFSEERPTAPTEGLSIDKKKKTVKYGKTPVSLTETEFRLLLLLYENKGEAVSNTEITECVWGNRTVENSNVSAVYVNYLRKKLDERIGKRLIFSVRGKGYMLKL